MASYRPFVLRIGQPQEDAFPLTADFQGLQARAVIPGAVLRQCLADCDQASLVPADPARSHLGSRLFAALFTGDVLRLYDTANSWLGPGEHLRIVLAQPLPGGLDALPWELIFDAQGEPKSLRNSPNTPVIRHAPAGALPHPPPQHGSLRVLAVISPPGFLSTPETAARLAKGLSTKESLRLVAAQLDQAALSETLRRLTKGRRYHVTVLQDATSDAVRDELAAAAREGAPYHIVHFFGQATGDGCLLLADSAGRQQGMSPPEFAELVITDSLTVLAVTLCQAEPARDTVRAVAEEATRRGAPAVVGMQVATFDAPLVDFSREFYRALAAGEPIELALAYGRRLVRLLHGPYHGFELPALYMAHTGGLNLPALERVHVVPRAWRMASWLLATAFAIAGTTSGILDLPSFPHMLRDRAPVIRCLWPNPMNSNRLTIAFMPLTVVDAAGRPTHGAAGHVVADYLYQRFEPMLADLKLDLPYEVRSPDLACQLPGRTAEARAVSAADYARRVDADILVYGVITDTAKSNPAKPGRMVLAFNVDYRGYENADEIAGPFALGGSLPVTLPFNPQELLVIEHPPHLVRMNVLAELVVGMSYLRADNPPKALTYFEAATADAYWPSIDGKEFAYLLKGQALLRQAAVTGASDGIENALEAYDTALSIKPTYVRAQLGKAGGLATLSVAHRAADGSRVLDRARLGEAEDAYRAVLNGGSTLAPLEWATTHAGLGYVYLTSALYGQAADADRARAELHIVTDGYEAGQKEIARVAGQAYGYLGLLAVQDGVYDSAMRYYSQALDLVAPVSRALYLARLSQLACSQGNRGVALDYGGQAVDDARLYGRAADVEEYSRRLEALQKAACP